MRLNNYFHWLCGEWPASWKTYIAFLELFPITLSLHTSNQCVSFSTDNKALVDIINQQTSKHSLIVVLVRNLVLTSLRHNVFRAFHVPGADTTRADFSFSDYRIQECHPRCWPRTNNPRPFPRWSSRYVKRITAFIAVQNVSKTVFTCLGCLYWILPTLSNRTC